MASYKIVPLYSGIFAFNLVRLSWRVIRCRKRLRIALGDGTMEHLQYHLQESTPSFETKGVTLNTDQYNEMQRAVRSHANFVEYSPLCLVLLFFSEVNGYLPGPALHAACIALLAGRMVHSDVAFKSGRAVNAWRRVGMSITFLTLITAGAANIGGFLLQ